MTPQDPQQPQGQPMPPRPPQPNQPGQPPMMPPPNQAGRPPMPPQPQPNLQGPPPMPPQSQPMGQPPMPPAQGQPGPAQPGQNRPDFQWQPAPQPVTTAGGATGKAARGAAGGAGATSKPGLDIAGLAAAFRPEPAKAPPLEWAGLAVSLVLFICGFLPWINLSGGGSLSGLEVGDGWIVMGAGLVAAILGFIGLSRDSISLAAGQALVGLIALGFAIVNLTGLGSGESAAFGLILTIVVALIVIGLGVYNAIDARRKGAKY